MISIASEYLYNNRIDVLWFLALLHVVNKGDCLQIQTYRVYYSNRESYSEFCIEITLREISIVTLRGVRYTLFKSISEKLSILRIVFCDAGFLKIGSRSKS